VTREHETGGTQRSALRNKRGEVRGDEIGIDELDRVSLARQVFARTERVLRGGRRAGCDNNPAVGRFSDEPLGVAPNIPHRETATRAS